MWKPVACPIAAGPPPLGTSPDQDLAHRSEVVEEACARLRGHVCGVPLGVREHVFRLPIPGVELGECRAKPFVGVLDARPVREVGQGVESIEMGRARVEEGSFVRKMAIHRRPLHAGLVGDRAHRRSRRADCAVELRRGLGDALSCLHLELGPPTLPVPAFSTVRRFNRHSCPTNIDIPGGRW